jgi:hypothetical protein
MDIKISNLVDTEVQTLLRNLDAMSAFMELQVSLYDGGREELNTQVEAMLVNCNEVIVLFLCGSPVNQEIAFKHLAWFVDRTDDKINSSRGMLVLLVGVDWCG